MQDEEQPMGQPTQSQEPQEPQTPTEATPPSQEPPKDQPVMPDKPKKSKGGKWWIVLLVILGVILLAVGGAWFYAKSTPQYSLYKMYKAAESKNYDGFIKYFNVDSVIDDLLDKALEQSKQEIEKQYGAGSDTAKMAQDYAENLINNLRDETKKQAKAEIKKKIETGDFGLSKEYKVNLLKGFLNTKVDMQSNGDAKVTVSNKEKKSVTFVMRKKSGYWEIYKIDMSLEELQNLY